MALIAFASTVVAIAILYLKNTDIIRNFNLIILAFDTLSSVVVNFTMINFRYTGFIIKRESIISSTIDTLTRCTIEVAVCDFWYTYVVSRLDLARLACQTLSCCVVGLTVYDFRHTNVVNCINCIAFYTNQALTLCRVFIAILNLWYTDVVSRLDLA
jgi:hypothetical protein